jgi:hypothetical protein
VGERGGESEP